MTFSSFVAKNFSHDELQAGFRRPRHPLVVYCHLLFLLGLGMIFLLYADKNLGQSLYFLAVVGLYGTSTAYHTWRPYRLLRFCDQTMICAYILAVPLPFIYHHQWAVPAYLALVFGLAIYKWFETDSDWILGCWIFLLLGAISVILMYTTGLTMMGESLISWMGFWITLATALFISKLVVYRYKLKIIEGYWESPELGHFLLAVAVFIYTCIVVTNPV